MTNKDQVGETVWFYSHLQGKVIDGKIFHNHPCQNGLLCIEIIGDRFPLSKRDAYDTKAEAVEATRAWAENGIKNLQTILDNLKDDIS